MTAGRVYTTVFDGVAVAGAAQQDLFEIVAPADACVELLEIHISQSSEAQDVDEEMLKILWKSGQTVSGSGGTAPTAEPLSLGDAAFGGTVEVNNTTKAGTGTIVTHGIWVWNIRIPFDVVFIPEVTKVLSPSARMTIELGTNPEDEITMSGYIVFKEIGG